MSSRSIGQLAFSRVIRRVSLTLAVTLGALSLNATAANATDPVWTTVPSSLTDTQLMAASDDGSHILVSSWFHLNISTDFGVTWTTKSPGTAGSQGWQTVTVLGDGKAMLADNTSTDDGGLWRSTNSGATWKKLSALKIIPYATSASDDGKLIFTTDYATGEMWFSTNSGAKWKKSKLTTAKPGEWVSAIVSRDGSTIVAANYSDIYVSKDKGRNWTKKRSGSQVGNAVLAMALSSDGSTIAVTQGGIGASDDHGSVVFSSDFGGTWSSSLTTELPSDAGYNIAISANGHRIVVALQNNTIWLSTDSAKTWTLQDVTIAGSIQGLASSLRGDVVTIYPANGAIYRGNYAAPLTYDVTYNAHGASSGSVPIDSGNPYAPNASVSVPEGSGSLVKTNYTLTSWNTQANGHGTSYAADGSGEIIIGNANVVLYAQWTKNLAVTTKPKVTGTAKVDKTLTAKKGSWNTPTPTYSYQWYSCGALITSAQSTEPDGCNEISSATGSTYKLTLEEKNFSVLVAVTAHRLGVPSITWWSKGTTPVQ